MIDLDALEKLSAEATPGPWRQDRFGVVYIDENTLREAGARWLVRGQIASVTPIPDDLPVEHVDNNAALIVAARNALPEMIAELRTMRADVAAAAGELLVPCPEPGTDAARMLSANVLMRRERDASRAERNKEHELRSAAQALVDAPVGVRQHDALEKLRSLLGCANG